jgi:hypothetical protein
MPAAVGDVAALVAQLQALAPADTGLAAWWSQCTALERLNAAVHAAGSGGDGASAAAAVVGAFRAAPQQLQVLVHALLVAEAWRERVLPHVGAHTSCSRQRCCATVSRAHPVRPGACAVATQQAAQLCHYLARYHEAVVANLLEALLSHDTVVQAAPEDALFELADYGSRAARVPGSCQWTAASTRVIHPPPVCVIHCAAGVPDLREAQRAFRGCVRPHAPV